MAVKILVEASWVVMLCSVAEFIKLMK